MNNSVMMKSADGTTLKVAPQFIETFLKCGYKRIENEESNSDAEKEFEAEDKGDKKQVKKASNTSGKKSKGDLKAADKDETTAEK